jgi:hypothetical protein
MADAADTTTTTTTTDAGATADTTKTADTGAADQTLLGGKTETAADTKTADTAKTEDKKTEVTEDKKADDKKSPDAPTVDAKALKLPEGFTADEAQLGAFATLANEFKLPQDAAQKLVDLHAAALKSASEASSKYWGDLQKTWQDEAKTTYGPEPAKNPKIIAVGKMIDSLGEKPASALREALDMSGMGNHPAIIAAFASLAERLAEPAHAQGNPANRPATAAQAIYPNMKQG